MSIYQKKIAPIFHCNTICALQCPSPDQSSVINSIYKDLAAEGDVRNIFHYQLSTGLKEAATNKKGSLVWVKANEDKITEPSPGENPIRYYLKEFCYFQDDAIIIFQDLESFISKNNPDPIVISFLKTIYQLKANRSLKRRIIILAENIDLYSELIREIPIIEIDLPSEKEIINSLENGFSGTAIDSDRILEIAQTATGLTINEIYDICFRTTYKNRFPSIEDFKNALYEHKCNILKAQGIEIWETRNIPEIGGHENFKEWIEEIEPLRNPEIAEELGLPSPRGCFLAGIPGCGKSLMAKMIARKWNLPLFILNLQSLKGSLVGESERNLKNALKLIDSQKGVVLIDEADKAINNQSKNDTSGVSSGMLSMILPWMEQTHNFIVMTCNDPSDVPQELTREGRLDSRWFVDLPDYHERMEILKIHCYCKNRIDIPEEQFDSVLKEVADATEYFSGSELEQLVIKTLMRIYKLGRQKKPSIADFRESIQQTVPLAKSFPEQHQNLNQWAKNAFPTGKRKSYIDDASAEFF